MFRNLALACAALIALSGCVTYHSTKDGMDEFRDGWKVVPAADTSDREDSWDAFQAAANAYFGPKVGVMTEADAIALFGKPLYRETTLGGELLQWHYNKTKALDWDAFVVLGGHNNTYSHYLFLSFDDHGKLFEPRLVGDKNPSSTIGATSRHMVEFGGNVVLGYVISGIVGDMLTRVSDHFTGNLQGIADGLPSKLESAAEKGVKNGGDAVVNDAKAAIKTDVTTKGGTVSGSVAGKPFSVTVPSFSGSVR